MDAIRSEKLTKYYGKARGVAERGLTVKQGGVLRLYRPQRRR